ENPLARGVADLDPATGLQGGHTPPHLSSTATYPSTTSRKYRARPERLRTPQRERTLVPQGDQHQQRSHKVYMNTIEGSTDLRTRPTLPLNAEPTMSPNLGLRKLPGIASVTHHPSLLQGELEEEGWSHLGRLTTRNRVPLPAHPDERRRPAARLAVPDPAGLLRRTALTNHRTGRFPSIKDDHTFPTSAPPSTAASSKSLRPSAPSLARTTATGSKPFGNTSRCWEWWNILLGIDGQSRVSRRCTTIKSPPPSSSSFANSSEKWPTSTSSGKPMHLRRSQFSSKPSRSTTNGPSSCFSKSSPHSRSTRTRALPTGSNFRRKLTVYGTLFERNAREE
ncbi:hypothetical protein P7C70_g9619, partial [Phenoliferia sp. Uapishka_3]